MARQTPTRTPSPRTVLPRSQRVGPVRFFREVWAELRRAVWPSREDTVRLTALVIAISLAVAFFLGVVDYLFSLLVNRLLLGG